jgi:hypothetical protein
MTPTRLDMLAEFNALVPRAQELGIRVRPRATWSGDTAGIQAKLESLRNSMAQFVIVPTEGLQRTFGCEFEFYHRGLTREELARRLNEAGIATRICRYDFKDAVPYWKLTTDGSLADYNHGSELVAPVFAGASGIEQIQKALRVLMANGCRVNKKCGFHVHIGVRADEARMPGYVGENIGFFKNLLRLYKRFEPVIDGLLAPTRRGPYANYCGGLFFRDEDIDRITSIADLRNHSVARDKFKKVNLLTYWRQGTIEFRHHQGTVDPNKAAKWISFLLRMVDAASKKSAEEITYPVPTLDSLLELIGLEANEAGYFRARHAHFAAGGRD